jgi:hypothetical protein
VTGVDAKGIASSVELKTGAAVTPIASTTSFRLRFNRFLLPGVTPIRQSICVTPMLGTVKSFQDCMLGVFFEPTYDPVTREVIFRQRTHDLKGETTYQVTVFSPTADNPTTGFRAFDGAPLDESTSFFVKTVATDPDGSVIEPPLTDEMFCFNAPCATKCETPCIAKCATDMACIADCKATCAATCPGALAILSSNCTFAGCHVSTPDSRNGGYLGPSEGLDLHDTASLAASAIGRVAHQTALGEHAATPDDGRFGRTMPIVPTDGNAGNSYLLYKLLVNPTLVLDPPLDAAEANRLRSAFVTGAPMPDAPGPKNALVVLKPADVATLRDWVLERAPTHACP